jgi:hypothetical protein
VHRDALYRGPRSADPEIVDEHDRKFFVEQSVATPTTGWRSGNTVFLQFEMFEDGSLDARCLCPASSPAPDWCGLAAVVQGVAGN